MKASGGKTSTRTKAREIALEKKISSLCLVREPAVNKFFKINAASKHKSKVAYKISFSPFASNAGRNRPL